jgi:probable F420-dependent oxidoreductase
MKFGGLMVFTEHSMTGPELACTLEECGFESVWAPEHSHIPVSHKTPDGGELPRFFSEAMDPFVILAAAAQATRTIKLGTGVLLVQQRDPIQTAKSVASLDLISQGRFLFGVGGGWNREEMENHGTHYETRFQRVRESVEAMKEIWTKDRAEFHGGIINFNPIQAWPKPTTKPYPPIHVGGAFPHGARRAIRYGDGWMPMATGRNGGFADLGDVIPAFRKMATDAGRDPSSMEISLIACPEDSDAIKRFQDLGVSRVIPWLPPDKRDGVLPIIDRWERIMRSING